MGDKQVDRITAYGIEKVGKEKKKKQRAELASKITKINGKIQILS